MPSCVVNRSYWPVHVELQFSAQPKLTRLATGDKVPVGSGAPLHWDLKPYELLALENAAAESRPQRLSASAPPEAAQDRGTLLVFDCAGGGDRPVASLDIGPGGHSVALGPKAMIHVAFNGGPDRYDLRKYRIAAGRLVEVAVVARSFMAQWPNFFPAATPLATDPHGQVWFVTDSMGKLLSLDPRSDTVRERGDISGRALAIQFGPDGACHVVGNADGEGKMRINTYQVLPDGLKPLGAPVFKQTLSKEPNVPIWGLLPDNDGGVYVRVVEEGYQKGWPALAIKKVYRDGRIERFLDFGELYAVRRTFGP